MKEKKLQRYMRTTVRKKRHIVQSLNTFTAQYDSAFIENAKINEKNQIIITKEPGLTIYFEETNLYKLGVFKDGSGMIYNKDVSVNDLTTYSLIVDTVDNIISINKKHLYKIYLKNIIEEFSLKQNNGLEPTCFFFNAVHRDDVISTISKKLEATPKFALSLYTQLHNRIKYRYVGIYATNTDTDAIKPKFLSTFDVLQSKLIYINRRKWWFNDSVLTALKKKIEALKPTSQVDELQKIIGLDASGNYIYEEEDINILDKLQDYNNIEINTDIEDETYLDAIEVLIYFYYEEENDSLKYPDPDYQPYQCNFINKETDLNDTKALEYIRDFNTTYELFFDNTSKVEQKKNLETEDEPADMHILDSETYNDTSLKDEVRESALAIDDQWNNFYNVLVKSILSDNIENNEFHTVYLYANELAQYHKELMNDELFFENGNINEYSSRLSQYRKDIMNALKETSNDSEKINKALSELLRKKKREWKLLHSEIERNSFIRKMLSFDYENLEFKYH